MLVRDVEELQTVLAKREGQQFLNSVKLLTGMNQAHITKETGISGSTLSRINKGAAISKTTWWALYGLCARQAL